MHKILIIEDHETLGYVLVEYLKMHDFQPVLETTAENGLKRMVKEVPHLCLLDVSLPGMDGFEMAKEIRKMHPELPIIFLTARGLKVDKIKGFMLHADDYIVKPVDEEELVLRIRAVLRRAHSGTAAPTAYSIGHFVFEPGNHLLRGQEGVRTLTEKEAAILKILVEHKGKLVTRNAILKEIWGSTDQFAARTMDVHLTRLRKHLAEDPAVAIMNLHGQGFILKDSKD